MVRKRPSFPAKVTPSSLPPEADAWANAGGKDPEFQQEVEHPQPPTAPPETSQPVPELPPNEPGKVARKFPHRISFDMDTPQYKRLKRASFDSDRPMNEVLREAVEDWLKRQGY